MCEAVNFVLECLRQSHVKNASAIFVVTDNYNTFHICDKWVRVLTWAVILNPVDYSSGGELGNISRECGSLN
jgi:hypothetical protein